MVRVLSFIAFIQEQAQYKKPLLIQESVNCFWETIRVLTNNLFRAFGLFLTITQIWVRERSNFTSPLPVVFSLTTQKRWKLKPWNSTAFTAILLEAFVPNLVSLTCPSFQISGKTQTGVFPISGFLFSISYKRKSSQLQNSRTSDDINMKLGSVTKLDKRNKNPLRKSDDDVISENYNVIVIFSYLLAI